MTTNLTTLDPELIAQDWKQRGFRCELWEDIPGHEWCGCVHETDELFMVLDGEIEVETQGKTIRPEIGEEIMIPAGADHTVRNIGQSKTRWLHGCWADFAQTD